MLAQTGSSSKSEELELAQTKAHNRLGNYKDVPVEERIMLAQAINDAGYSWKASAYVDSPADGLTLAQTSSKSMRGQMWSEQPGF